MVGFHAPVYHYRHCLWICFEIYTNFWTLFVIRKSHIWNSIFPSYNLLAVRRFDSASRFSSSIILKLFSPTKPRWNIKIYPQSDKADESTCNINERKRKLHALVPEKYLSPSMHYILPQKNQPYKTEEIGSTTGKNNEK